VSRAETAAILAELAALREEQTQARAERAEILARLATAEARNRGAPGSAERRFPAAVPVP
jgi:hypothetical protein